MTMLPPISGRSSAGSSRSAAAAAPAASPQETFSYTPGSPVKHGLRASAMTNQGWADPQAKEFYEKGKAAEHRMFYSQSECGDCCGDAPECMCSICICGNHRCPEVLRHIPYPNLKSEYRKKYPGHDKFPEKHRGKQRGPFKPTPVPGMYERPEAAVAEGGGRHRPLPDKGRPQLAFEGQTEYKDSYIPKRPDTPTDRAPERQLTSVPFTGNTEHRRQYDGAEGEPAKPTVKGEAPLDSGPFKGLSEYDDRYQGEKGDTKRRGPPQQKPWEKGDPRDLSSTYQEEYTGNTGKLCPARLLPRKKPGKDDHMHYHFSGQYNKLGDPLYHH